MPDSSLVDAYARAVLSSALDRWVVGLETLRDGLRHDDAARGALADTSLPFEARHEAAEKLCGPESQTELMNLAHTLAERGHLDLLDDLIAHLRRLSRYGPEAVVALVTSAVPLEEETKGSITRRLTDEYGPRLAVEWKVDPAILGGLVIQVGDRLMDDSVATRLERLRRTLRGRE